MTRRIALITTLLVLALAAPAGAQSGRLRPAARRRSRPPTPTADGRPARSDDGTTGRNVLFIIGGALIIGFGVMGWLILRDARSASAKDSSDIEHDGTAAIGPHKHKQQAKAKARKTHAAQQQGAQGPAAAAQALSQARITGRAPRRCSVAGNSRTAARSPRTCPVPR